MTTPDEIAAFRLRYRAQIVENMALKAMLLISFLNRKSLSESQTDLKDWLDKCSETADQAYGAHFRDPAIMALYADEVKAVVEEMKYEVDKMVTEIKENLGKT